MPGSGASECARSSPLEPRRFAARAFERAERQHRLEALARRQRLFEATAPEGGGLGRGALPHRQLARLAQQRRRPVLARRRQALQQRRRPGDVTPLGGEKPRGAAGDHGAPADRHPLPHRGVDQRVGEATPVGAQEAGGDEVVERARGDRRVELGDRGDGGQRDVVAGHRDRLEHDRGVAAERVELCPDPGVDGGRGAELQRVVDRRGGRIAIVQRAGDRLQQEGVATGGAVAGVRQPAGARVAEQVGEEESAAVGAQRLEHEGAGAERRLAQGRQVAGAGADARQQGDRRLAQPSRQVGEQADRRGVGPVEVVDDDQEWPLGRHRQHSLVKVIEDGADVDVDRHRGVTGERLGAEQLAGDAEGEVALVLARRGVQQARFGLARDDGVEHPRLADPRLAFDQDQPPVPGEAAGDLGLDDLHRRAALDQLPGGRPHRCARRYRRLANAWGGAAESTVTSRL